MGGVENTDTVKNVLCAEVKTRSKRGLREIPLISNVVTTWRCPSEHVVLGGGLERPSFEIILLPHCHPRVCVGMRVAFSRLKKKAKVRLSLGGFEAENNGSINLDHGGAPPSDCRGWKSTVSATAKLVLYAVRDSADAFPPLKSVAGGLCFILDNYEVLFIPPHHSNYDS